MTSSNNTDPKAWVVPVWTERLDGGKPVLVCYIAAYSDPREAQEAVKRHIGATDGDRIQEPSPVSNATVEALKVKPSNVWML